MKKLTITKERFLDWYFESGQDSENASIKDDLATRLIKGLQADNSFTITTQDIFDECNHEAIRCYFLEEYADDTENYDIEVSDLNVEFEISLID